MPRKQTILIWSGQGRRLGDIADELRISEPRVKMHLEDMKEIVYR
ncbi:hypothetical protein [Nitrospira sp. Nam74]